MFSYEILNNAYMWIQRFKETSIMPDDPRDLEDLADVKIELVAYLKVCYGDLCESIYGRLSDDFINMAVDKVLRAYVNCEV